MANADELDPIAERPKLPKRLPGGHKGTFGRVLVVAGSRDYSGAAVLAGTAAVRGGAGLVEVACPGEIRPWVAVGYPCYLTFAYESTANGEIARDSGTELAERVEKADVVALGPGLGNSPLTQGVARLVVAELVRLARAEPQTVRKLVADADGLFALDLAQWPHPGVDAVLTPHPGEFGRLLNRPTTEVQADRVGLASKFAADYGVVLLLKGAATVVTDGRRRRLNPTGNPGMGTGGTGDVLTGLVAALFAQGLTAFDAASLGAWVHGRAGDLAAAELSQTSLTARDVLDYLSKAFREVEAQDWTPGTPEGTR